MAASNYICWKNYNGFSFLLLQFFFLPYFELTIITENIIWTWMNWIEIELYCRFLNLWSIITFLDFNNNGFFCHVLWISIGNCQVSLGFFFCPCLMKVKIIMIFTDIKLKYWLIPWAVLSATTPHRFAPSLKD